MSDPPPILTRGPIKLLRHLSAGTDVAATHLVAAHNGVGYGYIGTAAGDVYFEASAVTNVSFDQLARDMTAEFILDQAPYLRTSHVSVVASDPGLVAGAPSGFKIADSPEALY